MSLITHLFAGGSSPGHAASGCDNLFEKFWFAFQPWFRQIPLITSCQI